MYYMALLCVCYTALLCVLYGSLVCRKCIYFGVIYGKIHIVYGFFVCLRMFVYVCACVCACVCVCVCVL